MRASSSTNLHNPPSTPHIIAHISIIMPSPRPKTVLITGCTEGGIGYAFARRFHQAGLQVFATARRKEAMTGLPELGIQTFVLDVTKQESVTAVRDEVAKITGGTLDILVNNAGHDYEDAALDVDLDKAKAVFEVNVFGVMRMVKEFTPLLIASSNSPRILNVGSIGAYAPLAFQSVYSATKGALHSYGNTLRLELAPFGIQVITLVAGRVKTKFYYEHVIPEDSLYASMREAWSKRTANMDPSIMIDVDTFADRIVTKVLKPSVSAWIWEGGQATLVWFLTSFIPISVMDKILSGDQGLAKFAESLQASKQSKKID